MKLPQWDDFRNLPVPDHATEDEKKCKMDYRVKLHREAMKRYMKEKYPPVDVFRPGRNVTGIPQAFNRSFAA